MKTAQTALLTLAVLLGLAGCEAQQRRRTFPVEVALAPMSGANEHGWTIDLSSARLNVGPVRFFTGKVLLSRPWRKPLDWLLPSAHAHPGHYQPGDALAELLTAAPVDGGGAPVRIGDASGTTGEYGSVELTFPTSSAGGAAGRSVALAGTAVKAGQTVRFELELDAQKVIEGVRFEKDLSDQPGHVRITARVDQWLGRADFGAVPVVDPASVTPLGPGTQPFNAFVRGVEDTSAYVVEWLDTP